MIKPKEKGQLNKQSGSGAIELDVYNKELRLRKIQQIISTQYND